MVRFRDALDLTRAAALSAALFLLGGLVPVFGALVMLCAPAPILFNATTGEVTTMLVVVHMKVSLVDTKSEKAVYHNDDMVFRQEYQISTDVNTFFEQQDPALERMARDLASHVVSDVLEGF